MVVKNGDGPGELAELARLGGRCGRLFRSARAPRISTKAACVPAWTQLNHASTTTQSCLRPRNNLCPIHRRGAVRWLHILPAATFVGVQ